MLFHKGTDNLHQTTAWRSNNSHHFPSINTLISLADESWWWWWAVIYWSLSTMWSILLPPESNHYRVWLKFALTFWYSRSGINLLRRYSIRSYEKYKHVSLITCFGAVFRSSIIIGLMCTGFKNRQRIQGVCVLAWWGEWEKCAGGREHSVLSFWLLMITIPLHAPLLSTDKKTSSHVL